jgi:chromosome segregation ATPase
MSENNSTKFGKLLQQEKVVNEKLKNQLIEFKHTNSLLKMETDILGSRVTILTNSIRSLGDAKEAEEKNLTVITELKKRIGLITSEKDQIYVRVSQLLTDLDILRSNLKEMNTARIRAIEEKDKFLKLSKEKVNFLEKKLKDASEVNSKNAAEIDTLKKNLKLSGQEKEFLRERINQMKFKRNINIHNKICRNCNKDFLEKENFKWS